MKVIVISDIHIHGAEDPLYLSLLTMIENEIGAGDFLVLGGDIFDFFVGRQSSLILRYERFFALLRSKAKQGAQIDYIEGNHDFHLSSTFASLFPGETKIRVHPAEVTLPLADGGKIYVAHGDLVDRDDWGYLALRAFFRSPFIRFVAAALPDPWVQRIGEGSSDASRRKNPRRPEENGPQGVERLRKKYRAFAEAKISEGYVAVILGHCHDLDGCEFVSDHQARQYLNVGYPRAHHSYIVCDAQGNLRRVFLPSPCPS
jgi:UDP-2,3-diacylglucosamine hydrolase